MGFAQTEVLSAFSVHGPPSERNEKIMQKIQCSESDDMLPEYSFDYGKARPNRFAKGRAIILEPDVARVFSTSESVNKMLRAIISAMPENELQLHQ